MKNNLLLIFLFQLLLLSCSHKQKEAASYQGIGTDSVKLAEIEKYSPTKLSNELAGKINLMLDIQTPGAGMLHPNGKALFFTWRVSGNTQIWKLNSPQGFPVQMTGGKDSTKLSQITPDGKYLIIERDVDGQENPGLYLQSVEGGPLIKIYHQAKVKTTFQFVSDDSQWIYFTNNEIAADSYAIYRVNISNIQNLKKEMVYNEPGLWGISDYKKNLLLLVKLTGSRTREYFTYDLESKKIVPVIGQKIPEEYLVGFSAHPEEFIVLTPEIGNFQKLYTYKIGGKLKPITENMNYDITSLSMDRNRQRISYEINKNGYTELHVLDAKTYKPISLPKFPNADHVFLGATSFNSKISMITVITSQAPRISYSYNWETKKLTQWTLPSAPEINLKKFVPSTLEYYTSRDGVKIPMFVRRPEACINKNCPVVVHFHGGPEGQSIAGFHTVSQLFIDENIIFVEPNVRGSVGYGKDWLNSDNADKRLKVITDIEDVSQFIKKSWSYNGVTPKIGVMGWSYGGYATLYAMTRFTGSYDSGVALVGMSNLLTFLNNTAPYRRKLRATEYGDPEKDKEALIKLSPMTYLDQLKSPLLIIQGANDPRVPVGEAIQIHKSLQAKNIKSDLIIFADEGHGTQKKENRILELGHTLNFFLQTLK